MEDTTEQKITVFKDLTYKEAFDHIESVCTVMGEYEGDVYSISQFWMYSETPWVIEILSPGQYLEIKRFESLTEAIRTFMSMQPDIFNLEEVESNAS